LAKIIEACGPNHLEDLRILFLEYAGGLGISLCFQGFEEELATLPGRYAPGHSPGHGTGHRHVRKPWVQGYRSLLRKPPPWSQISGTRPL